MKCVYCNKLIPKGTGKELIKIDGKILFFCSSKCQKNMLKLKRKPAKLGWTKPKQT